MKTTRRLFLTLLFLGSLPLLQAQHPESKAGWDLGVQAYSFRLFTFAEALKKADSCGLRNVEAYAGQRLGGGLEGSMDYKMDQDKRKAVKQMLKEMNIRLTAFGVITVKGEEEWTRLFEFAKDMGIRTINTEAVADQFGIIARLAEKHRIYVAVHNHPKPSRYWTPDNVLKVIGSSRYIGACADIGHWVRSGLDPVECLRLLEGRVLALHFKDLVPDANNPSKYHDVVWGRGQSKVDEVIAELKRQKFKGPISAEYEHNWDNSVPDIRESVRYFREAFARIKPAK